MEINKIIKQIENFAPLELQETWDCSGWVVKIEKDVKKVLLCLSVTKNIIDQAIEKNCDMIVSHHPMFFVPFEFNKNIPIYCAHTNLDKCKGGTTDTMIDLLGIGEGEEISEFLRMVELRNEILLDDFVKNVKAVFGNETLKVVNNFGVKKINKIAFCAGSGADLIEEAKNAGADVFVTGDVKYHCALESNVIIVDVGHFESEIPVLKTLKRLIEEMKIEVLIADEKSPFINY